MSTVASSTNTTNTTNATNTTTSAGSTALSQNDFLKILMAQLKNQDPLNPTDTNSFVQEMCQLTSTQAITQMQTDFSNLVSSLQNSNMGQWASTIGDYMQVSSTSVSEGDQVSLAPTGSYDSLTLTLKDASGTETTKTFSSTDTPTYSDTDGNYTIVSANQTTNGVSTTCNYNVYRLISAIQGGTSGTSLVATDGTAYATSSIKQIVK